MEVDGEPVAARGAEDAADLGGTSGVTDTSGDVGGFFNQLNNWVALVMGTIVTLPNRSQVIG